jgi:hypothetical protein
MCFSRYSGSAQSFCICTHFLASHLGSAASWVVERTFSWFGRNRRLAKDYENLADTLAAFITLACIQLAIRRLARA